MSAFLEDDKVGDVKAMTTQAVPARDALEGEHSTLLLELSAPPQGKAEEFDRWYEQRMLPARHEKSVVLISRRYQDITSDREWLATYYLGGQSNDNLLVTGGDLSQPAGALMAQLPRFEQRRYERVPVPTSAHEAEADDTSLLMAVWWTPKAGTVDDFNAWYDEEHIPMLMKVPGWKAIQRYRLADGTGPAFVALHFLESLAVLEHPAHREAGQTAWRARSAANREQHERRIFRPRLVTIRASTV